MTDESVLEWAAGWVPEAFPGDPTYRQRFLASLAAELKKRRDMMGSALTVIESFKPLAHAARAIIDDGWPNSLTRAGTLAPSLEARLITLKAAYESIADMVADADAEAAKP